MMLGALTKAQQTQLLTEWNQTDTDFPLDKCVHQLFEEQAERTPDAIAVVFENSQLTYQALNQRANQLAHHLKQLGVGPEVLVGIYVERSLEMIVGLLGILKAGGAYVPLEPTYPHDRITFMLDDAQTPVLLTQAKLAATLTQPKARVICLDTDWERISQQSQENLPSQVKPENLAYVIYTSGSTGKPKGVLINHYNVVRLFQATEPWFHFNDQDVWTFFHSHAFDFSVWELWGALFYGGRLVIVPYWISRTPEKFHELLSTEQVTVLNQTPSAFYQLIQIDESATNLLNLRLIIFGGEALELQSLKPWFERHGDESPQLVNMYGITETTVHVTYRPIKMADLSNGNGSVIGKPIPDLQIYLLNEELQQVPVGTPGEIYVGGAGLARGYLNRSELTKERFISNPFSDKAENRLYKSGDLGCYYPNGELEYQGRIDHQVKIRGFRIELGEIESVLQQCASVQQAVVLVREDEHHHKHLVAYIASQLTPQRLAMENNCFVEFKDNSRLQLKTEDISCGGVRLVGIPPNCETGQDVRLGLQLPASSDEIWLEGRVAWCKGQRAGIQFSASPGRGPICQNLEQLFTNMESSHVEMTFAQDSRSDKQDADDFLVPKFVLKRLPIQSVCQVAYDQESPIEVKTENISCDGIRLTDVPSTWQVGKAVCLHLQLPNLSDELCLEGTVSWCQGKRAGIQLTSPSVAQTQLCQTVGKLFKNYRVLEAIQRTSTAAQHIRHFLQDKLPAYMVPANFVFVKHIPLTPNGKVDRKALLAPHHNRPELIEENFAAARTSTEETLAKIWAEVLQLKQVSVYDDFIELGGHSLLAAHIIVQLREVFQTELPLQSLFEYPTIAKLAERIDTLREETSPSTVPPLKPRIAQTNLIPLSFSQQQLWLLAQIAPEVPVYNEPFTIRLGGPINVDALEQSFNEILRRHEALRTLFTTIDGQPMQVVVPFTKFNLPIIDLRALPENQRESVALQQATDEAKQPFDLTQYPLFRATLRQLDEADYRLFLTFHHIIIDGVSVYQILLPELEAFYKAFLHGKPLPLPEPSLQYPDFAQWQRQSLQPEKLTEQLAYWRQQLADLSPLQLPTDRSPPAQPTFRGARHCFALSKQLTDGIKALSRQEGVTLFVTLLAAFKILLYRYSGQPDIAVGTVTAGRNHAKVEQMMGDFLNTLVLRTDFVDNPSFRQLLQRVREVTVKAYAHQDLPFEQLVNELQPNRSSSANPLIQALFDFDPPIPNLELDWTLSQLDIQTDTAKFDLTMELDDRPTGIIGRIEYNTDLFDKATIIRMSGHYQRLLEGIVIQPEQQVSHLPLLTEQEQQQFVKWNNTQTDFPVDVCIHQLFERQVEQTPDAVAVVFEGQQLSYRKLNQRANQLAHYLMTLGVKPETLVGICVERSLEMVVGLLGILKAGGAYVPLDPNYPQERLGMILEDAQTPILLTQSSLIKQLPSHQAQVICLDTNWEMDFQLNIENKNNGVKPGNLAYVIYTSGSTGKPKGVAIEHHSTVALSAWAKEIFSSEELAGVLASTSICFDLSVFELFVPLSWGGKVILVQNALHLSSLPADSEVTLLNTVPSAMGELVRTKGIPASVRVVNLAGEPLKKALVQQIYHQETVAKVFNLYGPSEDTTYSTFALTEKDKDESPSIGCSIANTQVYVLDAHLQQVPIGVYGELYIGGEGLARGYLNRPELTAEKFIQNPFSQNSKERLYKTGDLVRYLPDGHLEFLGRIDHQVKVRGFRIELGEIEAVLNQHNTVQEVVVIVREDTPGDKRLVAYLVVKSQSELSSTELRRFVQQKLPEYMVPSAFVFLEALPLTPNGKIDRKALPQPDGQRADLEMVYVAPQTELERKIASVLQTVLQVDRVGVQDNFFDLGGNSLLLVQVQEKLVEVLKQEIPVVTLFQYPTIKALVHHLKNSHTEKREQILHQKAYHKAMTTLEARKRRNQKRLRVAA